MVPRFDAAVSLAEERSQDDSQNDSCIKMGSDESHFNVALTVKDKVTRLSIDDHCHYLSLSKFCKKYFGYSTS